MMYLLPLVVFINVLFIKLAFVTLKKYKTTGKIKDLLKLFRILNNVQLVIIDEKIEFEAL